MSCNGGRVIMLISRIEIQFPVRNPSLSLAIFHDPCVVGAIHTCVVSIPCR